MGHPSATSSGNIAHPINRPGYRPGCAAVGNARTWAIEVLQEMLKARVRRETECINELENEKGSRL